MSPQRDPVPRARAAIQWLSGLLLLGFLAAGVVAAAVALWENVDVQSLARQAAAVVDRPPQPPPQAGPLASGSVSLAVLYDSRASGSFFPDSTFYPSALARWERLLREAGTVVRRFSDPARVRALSGVGLLVAPEAICLSREEVDALRAHVEMGGGLVLTRATGARDERCRWRGWDVVQSLTGALDVVERPSGEAMFMTLPFGLPLSAGIPPGTRVELHPDAHLALLAPGPHPYWCDWALNPIAGENGATGDAAALLRSVEGGGRVAWFGFREDQGVGPDEETLRRILGNGLRWAAGKPIAELAPWPEGRQGALLIGEDVEAGFENSAALASLLRRKGGTATFFAVSALALEHPELADSLLAVGEIASQTADHSPTAGLPLREQAVRLRRSWNELQEWAGVPPTGLRPPEERFDAATLEAWRSVGGEYLAAINDGRSAAPTVYPTPAGPVVLLPRLIKDDYNVFVQDGRRDLRWLAAEFASGMRKVASLGGLAYVSIHSQIAGTPERIGVIGAVLDSARVRPDEWWIADGAAIARWWLGRTGVSLDIDASEPDSLTVTVGSVSDLRGAWIELYDEGIRDSAVPVTADGPLPYARTEWGIRFALPPLARGTEIAVRLVQHPDVEGSIGEPPGDGAEAGGPGGL